MNKQINNLPLTNKEKWRNTNVYNVITMEYKEFFCLNYDDTITFHSYKYDDYFEGIKITWEDNPFNLPNDEMVGDTFHFANRVYVL